jgi:AcrR family transcriptional regulator
MARITKDPMVRMTEILDAAEELFYAKGYHETQISDIVKSISVAQGTFYYYFKSKDEILEALINRRVSEFSRDLEMLVGSATLNPLQKLEEIIQTMLTAIHFKDGLLFDFLYDDRTLHLMDKLAQQGMKVLAPFWRKIIEEGVQQKIFQIDYPILAVNFVNNVLSTMFQAIYERLPQDQIQAHGSMTAVLIDRILGLPEGSVHIPPFETTECDSESNRIK